MFCQILKIILAVDDNNNSNILEFMDNLKIQTNILDFKTLVNINMVSKESYDFMKTIKIFGYFNICNYSLYLDLVKHGSRTLFYIITNVDKIKAYLRTFGYVYNNILTNIEKGCFLTGSDIPSYIHNYYDYYDYADTDDILNLDNMLTTPLHVSIFDDCYDTAIILMNYGDMQSIDALRRTPFCVACLRSFRLTEYMLKNYIVDIHHKSYENHTPLHAACFSGNLSTVNMLLEASADVNAVTTCNETPIFYAWENISIVKSLIKNTDVTIRDYNGRNIYEFINDVCGDDSENNDNCDDGENSDNYEIKRIKSIILHKLSSS